MLQSSRKKLIITSVILLIIIIPTSILVPLYVFPLPPKKPNLIPLGDFSYVIDYSDYSITKLMKDYNLPSVAISLIDDQDVIWQKAYGYSNLEEKLPATINTTYRVGSISKIFTAIEIMRLYEEGLIDLDTPLTNYLPYFSINNSRYPDSDPITIRSMLSHRSGLPRNGALVSWHWESGINVLHDLTTSLQELQIAFPVGYRYKYSNVAFDVLGHLIEVLRNDPFAFYMKNELLTPFNMTHSSFLKNGIVNPEIIALGYYNENGKNIPINQYDIINLASGNLYSTLGDLSEFIKFIFRGGEANGNQIINQTTLEMMYEDQYSKPRDPQTNGLGWFTYTKESELFVYHSGDIDGTISNIVLMPNRKVGVVLFSNSANFDSGKLLAFELVNLMFETKYGLQIAEEDKGSSVVVENSILEKYIGKYILFGEVANVFLQRNKFKLSAQGFNFKLIALNESKFRVEHWLIDIGYMSMEFFVGDEAEEDIVILGIENINYDICPKYDIPNEIPLLWTNFLGNYEEHFRHHSIYTDDNFVPAKYEIKIENGILMLNGYNMFLKPISESQILIIGGIYDGEVMIVDGATGNIAWSNRLFKPITNQ